MKYNTKVYKKAKKELEESVASALTKFQSETLLVVTGFDIENAEHKKGSDTDMVVLLDLETNTQECGCPTCKREYIKRYASCEGCKSNPRTTIIEEVCSVCGRVHEFWD